MIIDYQPFLNSAQNDPDINTALDGWLQQLPQQIEAGLDHKRHGDLPRWLSVLNNLPTLDTSKVALDQSAVSVQGGTLDAAALQHLTEQLKGLQPWRKGPFNLFGVEIDTEWRSDWKWDRLAPHIEPLKGRRVLDIGCGSGYHCWRMRGAGADWVVGIDPTPLFVLQFFSLQKYIQDPRVAVLPMGIEQLPSKLRFFDSVFSMGVLYHRRSPFDHLIELRDALRKDGELILETLVIEGNKGQVLVPEGRYARMGNIWFLPSCDTLASWLAKAGFKDIRLLDVNTTSLDEQRRSDWMTFHSLREFLDPEDISKTIEGYPAPRRAIFSAKAR